MLTRALNTAWRSWIFLVTFIMHDETLSFKKKFTTVEGGKNIVTTVFYIRSSLQKSHQCTYLHAGTLAKLLQISVITLTLHLTNLQQKNKQQANTNKPYALIRLRQPFDSFLSTPCTYTFHTSNEPHFRWLSMTYRFLTHIIHSDTTSS